MMYYVEHHFICLLVCVCLLWWDVKVFSLFFNWVARFLVEFLKCFFFFSFLYIWGAALHQMCSFSFSFFQLEGNYLAYCDCFVHHHESVIGIHTSPLSWNSLPPLSPSHHSKLSQSTHMGSLIHTANPHLLSILHMVMYVFQCYSLKSSHPRSLPFISVSPLLPCK